MIVQICMGCVVEAVQGGQFSLCTDHVPEQPAYIDSEAIGTSVADHSIYIQLRRVLIFTAR